MDIWEVLELTITNNENDIRQAYRKMLITVNPEDDAEGFMRLRNAYEQALQYAKETEKLEKDIDNNIMIEGTSDSSIKELDFWICSLEENYSNLDRRLDINSWKETFNNDLCIGIDTSLEAREKLLVFLMDHYRLPHDVWKLIDKVFRICDEIGVLEELFPSDFLEYISDQIQYGSFLNYTLFQINKEKLVLSLGMHSSHMDLDQYIDIYLKLKNELDEDDIHACDEHFAKLHEFYIFHPYQVVEKIRYLIIKDEIDAAAELSEPLIKNYPADNYIRYTYARVKYLQAQYEDACNIFEEVIHEIPKNNIVYVNLIKCLIKMEDFTKAKEITLDLCREDPQDETILGLLHQINDTLIQQFEKKDKDNTLDEDSRLELAWCLYQDNRYEEAKRNLEKLSINKHNEYDFISLCGRVDLALELYEDALNKCKHWLNQLLCYKRELGEEEFLKHYRILGYAYYAIGVSYLELGNYKKAVLFFRNSIKNEENHRSQIQVMISLADTYLRMKRFDKCITICEQILDEDKGCYPAYLYSMEASFKLGEDQNVINYYYEAIKYYAEDLKPYLFALKVFMRHDQYEDAREVLKAIKEKKLNSNDVKLQRIKLIRSTSKNPKMLQKALKYCLDLKQGLNDRENDIEDITEVDFEMSLLYGRLNEFSNALKSIDEAIKQRPSDQEYYRVKGNIFKNLGNYEKAIQMFNQIFKHNTNDYGALYEIAECYLQQTNQDDALELYLRVYEMMPDYKNVTEKISDIYIDKYKNLKQFEYYKQAIDYADKLINVKEDCYNLICRGIIYVTAYEFDQALKDYYKALEYNASDWAAFNNIGAVFRIKRNMVEAIEKFIESTRLVPMEEQRLPYGNLGDCYQIIRSYDKAIQVFEELLKHYPDYIDYFKGISESYKMQGKYLKSIEYQKRILEMVSLKSKSYQEVGLLYHLMRKNRKANYYYKKAIESDKNDIDAYYSYAKFLLATKKYTKAVNIIYKLTKIADSNDQMIDICEMIAAVTRDAYMIQKQEAMKTWKLNLEKSQLWAVKALEYINKIYGSEAEYYSFKPTRRKKLISLSSIYLYMGNEVKAEYLIQQALQESMCDYCKHTECDLAYKVLGMIREERGELQEAYDNYLKCVTIDPSEISVRKHFEYVKTILCINDKE